MDHTSQTISHITDVSRIEYWGRLAMLHSSLNIPISFLSLKLFFEDSYIMIIVLYSSSFGKVEISTEVNFSWVVWIGYKRCLSQKWYQLDWVQWNYSFWVLKHLGIWIQIMKRKIIIQIHNVHSAMKEAEYCELYNHDFFQAF